MKTARFKIITTLIILGLLAIASVYGQLADQIRVTIPFAFVVGETTLSSGEYIITLNYPSYGIVAFRKRGTHQCATVETIPAEANAEGSEPKLIFHRYSDQYFLSTVGFEGASLGRELIPSEFENQLIKSGSQAQKVILAPKKLS